MENDDAYWVLVKGQYPVIFRNDTLDWAGQKYRHKKTSSAVKPSPGCSTTYRGNHVCQRQQHWLIQGGASSPPDGADADMSAPHLHCVSNTPHNSGAYSCAFSKSRLIDVRINRGLALLKRFIQQPLCGKSRKWSLNCFSPFRERCSRISDWIARNWCNQLGGLCDRLIAALLLGKKRARMARPASRTSRSALFISTFGFTGGPRFFANIWRAWRLTAAVDRRDRLGARAGDDCRRRLASQSGHGAGPLAGAATESAVIGTASGVVAKRAHSSA